MLRFGFCRQHFNARLDFSLDVATALTRLSPESARLIRPVLAHSGFRTAEQHYIHAQTIDAGRDYAAVVQRLKKGR